MAKAEAYKRQKQPRPVCRPTWIVDSVREGKLLPYGKYLLVEYKDQLQFRIQSIFQRQKDSQRYTKKSSPEKLGIERNNRQHHQNDYLSPYSLKEPTCHQSPIKLGHGNDIEKGTLKQPDTADKKDNKYIDGKVRTVGTDPNFLDSYFSSSRLSFIGSFKQRTSSTHHPNNKSHKYSSNTKRLIFHVDMDCFFAAVALRNYPQYRDKPVVISHHGKRSNDEQKNDDGHGNAMLDLSYEKAPHIPKNSSSECATCNYVARNYGIKKGMFLGRAKELCPKLIVLSYDFKGYEEVSQQVLEILDRLVTSENHRGNVEVVSCDEAYVELYFDDPNVLENLFDYAIQLAESVRTEIFDATQCTASIGIGCNKFLAKLGTDKVKPNKSYCVRDYEELLKNLKLRDFHGIGRRLETKLSEEGLVTVQDIWDLGSRGENELIRILGSGTGKKIYDFTQGKDNRPITPVERKTIGAECNYGVRFDGPFGIDHFMEGLAKEVEKRMEGISVKGKRLTLKIKQRKNGSTEPSKFLGHGSCNNLSKISGLSGNVATRDAKIFKKVGLSLLQEFAIGDINDIRGMGIIISSLENDNATEKQMDVTGMQHWLQKSIDMGNVDHNIRSSKQSETSDEAEHESPVINDTLSFEEESNNEIDKNDTEQDVAGGIIFRVDDLPLIELPPMSQIHMSQVEALPIELQRQIVSRMKKAGSGDIEERINMNDTHTRHVVTSEINYANRFRQTDLKRMMKLAAVKSGQERTGISLTQLEELPLEIKLQVVNQDTRQVGVLSQRTSRTKSSNHRRLRKSTSDLDNSHLKTKRKKSTYARNNNEGKDEGIQSVNINKQILGEEDSNMNLENIQIINREDLKEATANEISTVRTLWKDTLEIFIHQILYRRRVYPGDTFCSTRYIGVQCKINRHPGVAAYIREALQVIAPTIFDNDDDCGGRRSDELLVEIYDRTKMDTFEQFSLSFPSGKNAFDVVSSVLKRELRDMIFSSGKLEGLQSNNWADSISFRIILLMHPTTIPKSTEAGDSAPDNTRWFRSNSITDHQIENRVVHHVPNSGCKFQYRLMYRPDQNLTENSHRRHI
ncbi:MAG: DNA repair protein REV1 [Bacillariaceae sp.]|jgi:DNA repair protein REV1